MRPRRTLRLALTLPALLAALGILTVPASAGLLDGTASRCGDYRLEQPFAPWLDPASYVLAPDGGLERGATGWKLTGGAAAVPGNESFAVGSPADSRSLDLPAGSSATTPAMCVSLDAPTLRLFVRNTGSPLSTLAVDVVTTGALGLKTVTPAGLVTGGASWQPTLPLALLTNLTSLPLLTDGTIDVAFRFRPVDAAGSWRIDDVYVDPFKQT